MRNELAHGYRIIVTYNDGTDDTIYEYASEKVADSVMRMYNRRRDIIKSVQKEEF